MKIFVKAKALSKKEEVIAPSPKLWKEEGVKDYYIVSVKDPPVRGKANIAIIKLLAKYFGVSQNSVRLVSGTTSKIKSFEISNK